MLGAQHNSALTFIKQYLLIYSIQIWCFLIYFFSSNEKGCLIACSSISTIKGELMPYLVRKQFSQKVSETANSSGEVGKTEIGE